MTRSIPLADRFAKFAVPGEDPEDCWRWTGYRMPNGYGTIGTGGRRHSTLAHRVSYELHVGPIPEGMVVSHLCDNRECTNPRHLRVLTQAENLREMDRRGRRRPPFTGALHVPVPPTGRGATRPLADRFWAKVDRSGGTEACWNWTASIVETTGYGQVNSGPPRNTMRPAHRVAWELANGPIPDGLWVLHRCDNRRCVNPSHLFLGTPTDNVRDMWAKGRGVGKPPPNIGVGNPRSKLDPDVVREIRRRCASGETQDSVAKGYGVTRSAVAMIVQRRTWQHVD